MRFELIASFTVFAVGCASAPKTWMRWVPQEREASIVASARAEATETSEEELLREGYAKIGWIYRHSDRGGARDGVPQMLVEAARVGGERVRIAYLEERTDKDITSTMNVSSAGGISVYSPGIHVAMSDHRRCLVSVWRKDAALAEQQNKTRPKRAAPPETDQQRCARGEERSCDRLLMMRANDAKLDASVHAQANELGARRCDAGDAEACGWLAYRVSEGARGRYGPTDQARSETLRARSNALMDRACQDGDADQCYDSAKYKVIRASEDERARHPALVRAAELRSEECKRGDKVSCHELAQQYWDGYGVARDYARGTVLFEELCNELGDPDACQATGIAYKHGRGVPSDRHRASVLYLYACENGEHTACWNFEGVDR
jgi:TPR repeat protein